MKRLDKRSLFVLIVTIAFLVAMVIYGAYAVINVSPQVNTNNLNIHSNISGPVSLTTEGGNVINLEVSKINMDQSLANNYIATGTDNLTVRLQTDGKQDICCSYKIAWEWQDDENETSYYKKSTGATNEFTLQGVTSSNGTYNFEVQIPNYDATNKMATIFRDVQICNRNNGVLSSNVTQDWTFTNKLYNLNVNQDGLKNAFISGRVKIIDGTCDVDSSMNSQILEKSNQTSSQDSSSWAIVNEGNGLRYEGKDPDNYVCFKESCTDDELYRIIGKFTEMVDTDNDGTADTNQEVVKIIKNTSIGNEYWDNDSSEYAYVENNNSKIRFVNNNFDDELAWGEKPLGQNDWSTASLKNYLNNAWTRPTSEILTTRWYLKTPSDYSTVTASEWLTNERSGTKYGSNPEYWDGSIALMYPSDYGYAVLSSTCARTTIVYNYSNSGCYDQNWLKSSYDEWLLTPSNSSDISYYILSTGRISSNDVTRQYYARPVFYIDANNPYKIIDTSYTIDEYLNNELPAGYRGNSHTNSATQNLYRYVGSYQSTDSEYTGLIDNYICLGSNQNPCPDNMMYRIIGVVAENDNTTGLEAGMVKVIKNKSIGSYTWDGGTGVDDSNAIVNSSTYTNYTCTASNWDKTSGCFPLWPESYLNTGILNDTYYNGLSYKNNIVNAKWHCWVNKYNSYPTADGEYSSDLCSDTSSKVALLYAGDYLNSFNNGVTNSTSTNKGWLKMSGEHYLLANWGLFYGSATNYSWGAWRVSSGGDLSYASAYGYFNIRPAGLMVGTDPIYPVFYLNNNIEIKQGSGTYSDPFRINEN